jgi:hypothetical protein
MDIIDKAINKAKFEIKFGLDAVSHVESLVRKWKPRDCETEKDYENSLYNYLEKVMKGKEITKQYGVGRSKVDLAVGKKVFIELKKDLKNTGQLQRLFGQLELYSKDLGNIMIILCGEIDKNLLKQLRDQGKAYSGSWGLGTFDCRILEKRP